MMAAVLGEGSMPVACADILLRRGFQISMAHSPDAPLRQWCSQNRVEHYPSAKAFLAAVAAAGVDFLFSILNFSIVPASVLGSVRQIAVNYHDGPLPRYAGVFATSWAIYNGESAHGITWHVLEAGVDTGDILLQRRFPIDPADTAETLNRKCYIHGVRAFNELAAQLASGTCPRTRQDPSLRTYYGFRDWPPADFRETLARATTLGPAGQRLLELQRLRCGSTKLGESAKPGQGNAGGGC